MNIVTIITPVYNCENYIAGCIESVRNQSYQDWEHILVDDCSQDGSAEIIKSFQEKDARIKYCRLDKNSGAGIARNKAIELSIGRYIAFLDSDDLWIHNKLEKQIKFMETHRYRFTFTDYKKVDKEGNDIDKRVKCPSILTYSKALYKNPIGCLTAIYDVEYFGKVYMPSIRKRQDYALWLTLLKRTNGYGIGEVLASYRVGNDSISSNKLNLLKYEWKIYREVEGLPLLKASFYLISAVILKLKSYF